MTDIINNDKEAIDAVTEIFALFGNDILNSKKFVQKQITDAQNIINEKDIDEKRLSNLIEIFDLVIEFPRGRINKEMEIKEFLNAKTPKEMVEALEMEIALESVEKGSDEAIMKDSIIEANNIKKKILNYLSGKKKFTSSESRILYNVNNINRHEINNGMNLSDIKQRMYQNDKWRNEIIRLLKMEKKDRENDNNFKYIIALLKKELGRVKDEKDEKKKKEKIKTLTSLIDMLEKEAKREIKTESFNIIKGSSGIVGNSSVPVPVPVPVSVSVPVSGKSIFTEKKCVEIAEYADQFCVKFTGNCDTNDNEGTKGGRKRKSISKRKPRRKKSRKYLRRKRRESRRKELKRIRKSKKKLV